MNDLANERNMMFEHLLRCIYSLMIGIDFWKLVFDWTYQPKIGAPAQNKPPKIDNDTDR